MVYKWDEDDDLAFEEELLRRSLINFDALKSMSLNYRLFEEVLAENKDLSNSG